MFRESLLNANVLILRRLLDHMPHQPEDVLMVVVSVFKVAASLNKVKKGVVRVCCVNWRQGSRLVEVAKISTKRRWAWKDQLLPVLGVI